MRHSSRLSNEAALTLGAQGASLRTRFLATEEMSIDPAWKQRIVEAGALDAVKVEMSERVLPPFTLPQVGRPYAPRALTTPPIEKLASDPEAIDSAQMGPALVAAIRSGGGHDLLPFSGESVELVHDIAFAGDLVVRLVEEAEAGAAPRGNDDRGLK
jgi:enoyl-[acyl-carrier protein] reductase II